MGSLSREMEDQTGICFVYFLSFSFCKVRFLIFLWVGWSRWEGRVEGEQAYLEGMPVAMPSHCHWAGVCL